MSESPNSNPASHPLSWRNVLYLVVLVLMLASVAYLRWNDRRLELVPVRIGDDVTVQAMIASTPDQRSRGLAVRDTLGEGEGMYFIFPEAGYPLFWMKDMKFPIDILWIRGDELVDMTMDLQPPGKDGQLPQYAPRVAVDRVLEVPAGFAQRHGLRLGMRVAVSLDTVSEVR
jgi:uncharacterized membrane protein (UPF0127 family)